MRKTKSPWRRRIKIALSLVALALLVVATVFLFVFMNYVKEAEVLLPKIEQTMANMAQKPSVILSSDGAVLYRVTTEYRDAANHISEIPKVVIDSTLAAEDKRFFDHDGVDYWAMGRMLFTNAKEGRLAQGGSTLTMQLSKRITSEGEKTYQRKLQDLALAVQMERTFSKNQILLLYLNQVYYGSGAYGIKAAASVYFNKKVDQLTLAEAALLARCVRRPSKQNPFDNLEVAVQNRNLVLGIMRQEGMITEDQYRDALKEKVKLRQRSFGGGARILGAPYFVNYVLNEIHHQLPSVDLSLGGYVVRTTLDSKLQKVAEKQVADVIRQNRRRGVTAGAFVLMDNKGRILCMVGGADYRKNQYNVVAQGRRQPGSSFKPFVYATALATGAITPSERLSNMRLRYTDPVTGKVWSPDNSGGSYSSSVTMKSAIARSLNVVAVRVMEKAGPTTVVSFAHDVFGFKSPLDPVLALALGSSAVSPLEMAQGYSVFQLKGDRATPFGIASVQSPDGNYVKKFSPNIVRGVLPPDVAETIDDALQAVVTGGTASSFRRQMPDKSRGKTGTTQSNRDAWFCGYTGRFVGVGWVGNEVYDESAKQWKYLPMGSRVFGGTVTVQIWAGVMREAVKLYGDEPIPNTEVVQPVPFEPDPAEVQTDDVVVEPPSGFQVPEEQPLPTEQPPSTPPEPAGPGVASNDPLLSGDAPPKAIGMGAGTGSATAFGPRTPGRTPGVSSLPPKVVDKPPPKKPTVSVEVCADNGLRATIYCPETIVRIFEKGKEPKKRCTKHLPKLD